MIWKYKCSVCGGYLDPGEGRICDDCQEKKNDTRQQEKKNKIEKKKTP